MSLKRSLSNAGSSEMSRDGSDFAKKWRQIRACARCHRLKMKCAYDDPSFTSCKRCFAAGVPCSPDFDPTSKFKISRPRKKPKSVNIPEFKQLSAYINRLQSTNNIMDLSTKNNKTSSQTKTLVHDDIGGLRNVKLQLNNYISQIDNLINQKELLLRHMDSSADNDEGLDPNVESDPPTGTSTPPSGADSVLFVAPSGIINHQNLPIIPFDKNLIQEIIKLNYLSHEIVAKKYDYFKKNLLVYWPAIKVPDFYTVEYLIRNKPLLLLTFIVNACVTSNDMTLYNILSYYLDINLAHKVFIKGNLSVDIIQSYLALSIWNPPPKKWGTFKHQLHLLTSLNLSLVVDLASRCERIVLGTEQTETDTFENEDLIRLYLMIYSSCGSLGLSLPKFKSVAWSATHELSCSYLNAKFMGEEAVNGLDRSDIFIYYMSKLICIGQEMTNKLDKLAFENENQHDKTLSDFIKEYEERLLKLMLNYRLTDPNSQSFENPLVGLTYQQILMSMYDHLIYRNLSSQMIFFLSNAFNRKLRNKEADKSYKLYKLSINVLEKLVVVCRKLIDTFLALTDKTLNIPTFFNYRPFNALISLVKAKILIKSLIFEFQSKSSKQVIDESTNGELINQELISDVSNLDFNLKSFFNHFYKKYEDYAKQSTTFEKMFVILKKMKKLIRLVDSVLTKKKPKKLTGPNEDNILPKEEIIAGFAFTDNNSINNNVNQERKLSITSNLANSNLLNLLYELGKEKAVENIELFELNEDVKKRNKKQAKNKNDENQIIFASEQTEPSDQPPLSLPVDASPSEQQMNSFFKELFSNNVFSDIINDASFENLLPFSPTFTGVPDTSIMETPSNAAINTEELTSLPVVGSTSDHTINDITIEGIGPLNKHNTNLLHQGGIINQFLSEPSGDLLNFYSNSFNINPELVTAQRLQNADSRSSTIDDYHNDFWMNKGNLEEDNLDLFTFGLQ